MFLLPFVFIVLTSLMTDRQSLSAKLWPDPFVWRNYIEVFRPAGDGPLDPNTMMYCGLATLGLLLSSIPVAYALARLRWRGRQVAFLIVLATMMLPQQVTVVPLYVLWSSSAW